MAFKLCLAPLRGITDALFRNTLAEFFPGIDFAVAPFISTTRGPGIKPSHLKEVLPENNQCMPMVPQILSKDAGNFIPLARALNDLGYHTVNWNLGCPYPMVARKGRGSGMLPFPERIEGFLERFFSVSPTRLSVKMRLGRHHIDEIFELLPILNQYPIKEIVIHPRTGIQMYEGKPHLEVFEKSLDLCRHPITYNGDIVNPDGFKALQQRFAKIETWMIGRGAVADPFLCSSLKGRVWDIEDRIELFRKFHKTLFLRYARRLYGPSHLLNRMKGLWAYFAKSFEDGQRLRKKINKTQKVHHYEAVVDAFFETGPQWVETPGGNR